MPFGGNNSRATKEITGTARVLYSLAAADAEAPVSAIERLRERHLQRVADHAKEAERGPIQKPGYLAAPATGMSVHRNLAV